MSKCQNEAIKKFVLKQCWLIKNEEKAEKFKVLNSPSFSAKAVNTVFDEDLGWIVEFTGTSQEDLKIGSWLVSITDERGILSSVSSQGFSLAVIKKKFFPVGEVFSFRLMYKKPLLQSAMQDILNESVYTQGHASRRVRDVLLGFVEPKTSSKKEKINFLNPNLNESQRKAVELSLQQEELSIIHGPPGTGKTTTLVEVIQQSRRMGKRILVCCASHAAVDNVMEKLIARSGGLAMVRLGHPVKVKREHLRYTLKKWRKKWINMKKLEEASIVFGTLTGLANSEYMKKLPQGHFHLTVVDECAQALEAAVWAVVRFTSKLLLAGDHLQLPPTVLSGDPIVKTALSVSIMERLVSLYNEPVVSMLDTQYRMTSTIMTWSSNTFYGGKLKAASSAASRTLDQLPGVKQSIITKLEMVLVDTEGTMVQQNSTTIQQDSTVVQQDFTRVQDNFATRREGNIIVQQGSKMVKKGSSMVQQGLNMIQEGSTIVQQRPTLIQKGSGMVWKDPNMILKGSNLVQKGSILFEKGSSMVQKGSNMVQKGSVIIQQSYTKVQQGSTICRNFSFANPGEADIVLTTVRELLKIGVRQEHIGVITYYALQADQIRKSLSLTHPEVEVKTVDGFQGREKEVIIVSTVRSNTQGKIGFLKEHRRLNVAVTRARRLLVIVADRNTFSQDSVWKSLFDYIEENGIVWEFDTSTISEKVSDLKDSTSSISERLASLDLKDSTSSISERLEGLDLKDSTSSISERLASLDLEDSKQGA